MNKLIASASEVIPLLEKLESQTVDSTEAIEQWVLERSNLESWLSEDFAWRYIRMTCDTKNETRTSEYLAFVQEIQPVLAPWTDRLNKKLASIQGFASDDHIALKRYISKVNQEIALYREENIPLHTENQELAQQYSAIQGQLSVEINGVQMTLSAANNLLKDTRRSFRKEVYEEIQTCRFSASQKVSEIFDKMRKLRHQIALNAGCDNFRDYMFKALNRTDYNSADCYQFHEAVRQHVVPLAKSIHQKRKQWLMVDKLKPYDLDVDVLGRPGLKPFAEIRELLDKTFNCLSEVHGLFGETLRKLESLGHLDLDSRDGKAPGGYNYPLHQTGVPFIFMNASGSLRDVETLIHETGHAVHSILMHQIPVSAYREVPSEVAELASMSMELLSRKYWNYYFEDSEDLNRALRSQIEDIIITLPWIAIIDRFQHEIYTHPEWNMQEVTQCWMEINHQFGTAEVDYSEYQHFAEISWQRQLHLFEVPFYYIEYGMAQLGAIAVWRRQMEEPETAIRDYCNALSLGNTQSIREVYQTAGISFDFSDRYIGELAAFLSSQLH